MFNRYHAFDIAAVNNNSIPVSVARSKFLKIPSWGLNNPRNIFFSFNSKIQNLYQRWGSAPKPPC